MVGDFAFFRENAVLRGGKGGGRKAVRPSITAKFPRQGLGRKRLFRGRAPRRDHHQPRSWTRSAIEAGPTRSWEGEGVGGGGRGTIAPEGRCNARARRRRGFRARHAGRPSSGVLRACGECDGYRDAATRRHGIEGGPTRLPTRPWQPAGRQRLSQGFHPCTPVVVAAVARGPDRGARAKGRGERRADPGTRQNAPKPDYARDEDSPSIAIIMPTSNHDAGATEIRAPQPSPGHRPEAHGP